MENIKLYLLGRPTRVKKNVKKGKEVVTIKTRLVVSFGGSKYLKLSWLAGKILFLDLVGNYKDICFIQYIINLHTYLVGHSDAWVLGNIGRLRDFFRIGVHGEVCGCQLEEGTFP